MRDGDVQGTNKGYMIKKFKISGMHCVSCANLIDLDLEEIDGVKSSKTSYAKSETTLEYDEKKLKKSDLIASINKSGYKVATSE